MRWQGRQGSSNVEDRRGRRGGGGVAIGGAGGLGLLAIVAIGAVAWACYSVLLKRSHFRSLPTIALFCAIACTGWILLLPLMVWELVAFDAFPRSADAWWSIMGVALIASVLAFSAFQYGIKILGPSVAGIFMYLLPIYGVSLAIVFLGEQLHSFHIAGFVCVAIGVALATLPSRLLS